MHDPGDASMHDNQEHGIDSIKLRAVFKLKKGKGACKGSQYVKRKRDAMVAWRICNIF